MEVAGTLYNYKVLKICGYIKTNPWRYSPPSLKGPLVSFIGLFIYQQAKPILVKKFYSIKRK
jgi:hypothetical protein